MAEKKTPGPHICNKIHDQQLDCCFTADIKSVWAGTSTLDMPQGRLTRVCTVLRINWANVNGFSDSPSLELDSETSGPVWRGIQLQPGGSVRSCFLPSSLFSRFLHTNSVLLPSAASSNCLLLSDDFSSRRWRWSNSARAETHSQLAAGEAVSAPSSKAVQE